MVYDYVAALVGKSGQVYKRSGKRIAAYCDLSINTVYRAFDSVIAKGFFIDLEPHLTSYQKWRNGGGEYRLVSHEEWRNLHPNGCAACIARMMAVDISKDDPENSHLDSMVARYSTQAERQQIAKDAKGSHVLKNGEPPVTQNGEQEETHVLNSDNPVLTFDNPVTQNGEHDVLKNGEPLPLDTLSFTPTHTLNPPVHQNSEHGENGHTSPVAQDESASAPIGKTANALEVRTGSETVPCVHSTFDAPDPSALLTRVEGVLLSRRMISPIASWNRVKWLDELSGLLARGVTDERIVESAARQHLAGIGDAVVAGVFAESIRKESR